MSDLSHWEFAEQFSGYDAAALILGLEPRESDMEEYRVTVVTDRMAQDYRNTIFKSFHDFLGDPMEYLHTGNDDPIVELISVQLEKLRFREFRYNEETPYSDWLADDRRNKFENQQFSRSMIVKWLVNSRMKSVYSFDRGLAEHTPKKIGRWPWGDHHTETLGHLEAAARRFWVSYDPADATTANTNATVSEWLQTERKVSKTMADSIASMLRPDGLPTGPRR